MFDFSNLSDAQVAEEYNKAHDQLDGTEQDDHPRALLFDALEQEHNERLRRRARNEQKRYWLRVQELYLSGELEDIIETDPVIREY